jgi:hypothetical protein
MPIPKTKGTSTILLGKETHTYSHSIKGIFQRSDNNTLMLHKDDIKPSELSKATKCFDNAYPNGKFLIRQMGEWELISL